ncbi:MAG: hypothetical protein ACR2NM_00560 [Bythopirellula sp.]
MRHFNEVLAQDTDRPSLSFSFSLPVAMLTVGVLLIGASFLPVGNWVARSQWSREDTAAYDRVSMAYKKSAYESPVRKGLSQAEWDAQRDRMRQQMESLQQKLDGAKRQPQRWSRYLLGIGSLLTAAGFYANLKR